MHSTYNPPPTLPYLTPHHFAIAPLPLPKYPIYPPLLIVKRLSTTRRWFHQITDPEWPGSREEWENFYFQLLFPLISLCSSIHCVDRFVDCLNMQKIHAKQHFPERENLIYAFRMPPGSMCGMFGSVVKVFLISWLRAASKAGDGRLLLWTKGK